MVRQVGVEGDAVTRAELVSLAVDEELDGPLEHHGRLAAAWLVYWWVIRGAGRGPGRERVLGNI